MADDKGWYIIGFKRTPIECDGYCGKPMCTSNHCRYDTYSEAVKSAARRLEAEPHRGPMLIYQAVAEVDLPLPDVDVSKLKKPPESR